jgi:hypothetical protein
LCFQIESSMAHLQDLKNTKKVKGAPTYLFSAFGYEIDTPEEQTVHDIIINTLDGTRGQSFDCHVKLADDVITVTKATLRSVHFGGGAPLSAKQYACRVTGTAPVKVVLSLTDKSTIHNDNYQQIIYPKKQTSKLAVCAKVVYGHLDPEKLVEWFEIQQLLGVDHVLAYALHVNEAVQRVFEFYTKLGLLEVIPFEIPGVILGRYS